MTAIRIRLAGDLAAHARGRTLTAVFDVEEPPSDSLPGHGVVMVFGREFQRQAEVASGWVDWVTTLGRLLLLLPPFAGESCDLPVKWKALRTEPLAGGDSAVARLLARERRYEIRSQMLPFERIAGEVVTAGWRRHPAAGLLVVTALPVWSLSTLDHSAACREWLADLAEQAGEAPPESSEQATSARRELVAAEWTVLLHLCTGPFGSAEEALAALAISSIHHLDAGPATEALAEIDSMNLAVNGNLTPEGRDVLFSGPYMPFARGLLEKS